jgi:hypothetical protein
MGCDKKISLKSNSNFSEFSSYLAFFNANGVEIMTNKMLIMLYSCIIVMFLFGCQNKEAIKKEASETTNKIRMIDQKIYDLQRKKAVFTGAMNLADSNGIKGATSSMIVDVDAQIKTMESERELLVMKLDKLMDKLY